jgi:hypothetical protein
MEKRMLAQQLDYLMFWNHAKPLMAAKLEAIRAGLVGRTDLRIGDVTAGGDEEYRLSVDLLRADDLCVLSLDFTLLDAAVNGGESGEAGISLSITGYAALVLGGYTPFAYSREAFTPDVDEIAERIQRLDVAELVRYITEQALHNSALQRALFKSV